MSQSITVAAYPERGAGNRAANLAKPISGVILYYIRSMCVRVRARVKHAHTNTNVIINNKTHILCKFILVSLATEHQHNN